MAHMSTPPARHRKSQKHALQNQNSNESHTFRVRRQRRRHHFLLVQSKALGGWHALVVVHMLALAEEL